MKIGDVLIVIFLVILVIGLIYFYQNLSSFDCFIEQTFGTLMSDIKYEFEPEGSFYGKTRVLRFIISSSRSRLEYFGMEISKENGDILFFENRTNPEGGSIIATVKLANETEKLNINRFFKKKCYPEVQL